MPNDKPSFYDAWERYKQSEQKLNRNGGIGNSDLEDIAAYEDSFTAFQDSANLYDSKGGWLKYNAEDPIRQINYMEKRDKAGKFINDNFLFVQDPKKPENIYVLSVSFDANGRRQLELTDKPLTKEEFEKKYIAQTIQDEKPVKPASLPWYSRFANTLSKLIRGVETQAMRDYKEAMENYNGDMADYNRHVSAVKEWIGLEKEPEAEQTSAPEKQSAPEKPTVSAEDMSADRKRDLSRIEQNLSKVSLNYNPAHKEAYTEFTDRIRGIAGENDDVRKLLTQLGPDHTRTLYGAFRTEFYNERNMDLEGMLTDAVDPHKQDGAGKDLGRVLNSQKVPNRSTPRAPAAHN